MDLDHIAWSLGLKPRCKGGKPGSVSQSDRQTVWMIVCQWDTKSKEPVSLPDQHRVPAHFAATMSISWQLESAGMHIRLMDPIPLLAHRHNHTHLWQPSDIANTALCTSQVAPGELTNCSHALATNSIATHTPPPPFSLFVVIEFVPKWSLPDVTRSLLRTNANSSTYPSSNTHKTTMECTQFS